jgi:hypothetical protein
MFDSRPESILHLFTVYFILYHSYRIAGLHMSYTPSLELPPAHHLPAIPL